MDVERCAIGFSAHTGWAAAVALAGPPDAPRVIDRRRVSLSNDSIPFQPYHAAGRVSIEEAEALVRRAVEVAAEAAASSVRSLVDELAQGDLRVAGLGVVLGNGPPVRSIAEALSSHAAKHGAEGQLYRDALLDAAEACGIPATGVRARDLVTRGAAGLGVADLEERIRELGRGIGPPWARDQREAAIVAWLALASPARDA